MFGVRTPAVRSGVRFAAKLLVVAVVGWYAPVATFDIRPAAALVWLLAAVFAVAVLLFDEVDRLLSTRLGAKTDDRDRAGGAPGGAGVDGGPDAGDGADASDGEWTAAPITEFRHRVVGERDRGLLVAVTDGDAESRFFVREDLVQVESPRVEHEVGEDWLRRARQYLRVVDFEADPA